MCYDAYHQTKKKLDYAKRIGAAQDEIEELERQLQVYEEQMMFNPHFHSSGFAHDYALVVTGELPKKFQYMKWGLIPSWCKDEDMANKMSNNTINCRSETMFEKPSFRGPAKDKRCIILFDGFFEHHHFNKKTYPFNISLKNGLPMMIGGLWDEWTNPSTGEVERTCTVVTTVANKTLEQIHNNPKLEFGPRMPFILPDDQEIIDKWLYKEISNKTKEEDRKEILDIIEPYPDEELVHHTAPRLRGKEAIGNVPEALKEVKYPELIFGDEGPKQTSLF